MIRRPPISTLFPYPTLFGSVHRFGDPVGIERENVARPDLHLPLLEHCGLERAEERARRIQGVEGVRHGALETAMFKERQVEIQIGKAHVWTPVTRSSPIPPS